MRLKGKVAVITGGATGIGRAAALQFGLDGAEVIVADVNDVEGVATARAITQVRGAAQFVRTDVSSETDVRALMKDVDDACGHLDILVNCAGIFQGMEVRVDDFEDDRWEQVIAVNLKGSYLCAKHAVPLMEKRGAGVILLVASIAGVTVPSSSIAYGASKGGVHGLAISLERQLTPLKIRVNTVCPSDIATPLKIATIEEIADRKGKTRAAAMAEWQPRLGDPAGVAKVMAFLASSDGAYVRGTVVTR